MVFAATNNACTPSDKDTETTSQNNITSKPHDEESVVVITKKKCNNPLNRLESMVCAVTNNNAKTISNDSDHQLMSHEAEYASSISSHSDRIDDDTSLEAFNHESHESILEYGDVASFGTLKNPKFILLERTKLNHQVYSMAFSEILDVVASSKSKSFPQKCRLAATCGKNHIEVFKLIEPTTNSTTEKREYCQYLNPILVFSSKSENENFYHCVFGGRSQWQPNPNLQHQGTDIRSKWPQLLCVGGKRGTIKVFGLEGKRLQRSLLGHTGEIMDIQISPKDEWLLLSASSDESLRIWNLALGSCIAVLAGHFGHKSNVIVASWNLSGTLIVSGGMDTTIKLWNIASDTLIGKAIINSMETGREILTTNKKGFIPAIKEQFPIFSSNKIHCQYVDCVQFVGDLIISKSLDEKIVIWRPIIDTCKTTRLGTPTYPVSSDVVVLRTFNIPHAEVWYTRFTFLLSSNSLVVGNSRGEIFVWDINNSATIPPTKLSLKRQDIVRSVQFSPEGNRLIATLDSGNIYVYDVTYENA